MPTQRLQLFTLGFNLFTILLWGAFVYAFLTQQSIEVPWSVVDLYLITLTFYAADKEIRRWRHAHQSRKHRGEYITLGWIVTFLFILGVDLAGGSKEGFGVPPHLGLAVGGVVVVYVVTQYLKAEYGRGFAVEAKQRSVRRRKR